MLIKRFSLLSGAEKAEGIVVLVDVLRAFTSLHVLMDRGASEVFMSDDVRLLRNIKKRFRDGVVLVGERNAYKLAHFDFGNDPYVLSKTSFADKKCFMSTSAGIRGLRFLKNTDRIFLGGFVSFSKLAEIIKREHSDDVVSVVALGKGGIFKSFEDELFAELFIDFLEGKTEVPSPYFLMSLAEKSGLIDKFSNPDFSKRFRIEDLTLAFEIDKYKFAVEAVYDVLPLEGYSGFNLYRAVKVQ